MNDFIPDTVLDEKEEVYSHGFSEEEVTLITSRHKEIMKRNLFESPVTRDEFKNIIVPMIRITRTKAFIIKENKKETKKSSESKTLKVPKEKKLTKKQKAEKTQLLLLKKLTGETLTEEEQAFLDEGAKQAL